MRIKWWFHWNYAVMETIRDDGSGDKLCIQWIRLYIDKEICIKTRFLSFNYFDRDTIVRMFDTDDPDACADFSELVLEEIDKVMKVMPLTTGQVNDVNKIRTSLLEYKEGKMVDNQVYRMIEAADRCRSEIVLCLLGKPGIGKTEAVERFARDHNRNVVHIIASQILPNEVSGMTMPNQDTHTMDVFDHVRLGHMKDGDILFFDELLKGQQQVLSACLTLIQERRLMSGRKLPDVLIVAAANPLASPMQLPLEIRQRFLFVDVDWNKDAWMTYLEGLGFNRTPSIEELADLVDRSMDKDSGWNTLTPRSATKMLLWYRSAGDYRKVVEKVIVETFGYTMANCVKSICMSIDKKQDDKKLAESVVKAIYASDDESRAAGQLIKDIEEGKVDDPREILKRIKALDESEQILEYLSNVKLREE